MWDILVDFLLEIADSILDYFIVYKRDGDAAAKGCLLKFAALAFLVLAVL